jgi:hypothetical protein
MNAARHNRTKPPVRRMHLGAAAGWILTAFGRARKPSPQEILQKELPATTRRMHVRLTERIRNTFRHRWLRKHR